MSHDFTHDDRIATIAACTTLGRSSDRASENGSLTPTEWNKLAQWLHDHDSQPADLLDRIAIKKTISDGTLDSRLLAKIETLPERASITALEIERFEHRGIWALARFEDEYPKRWRQCLKAQSPPVIFGAGPAQLINERAIAIVGSREIGPELMDTADLLGRSVAKSGFVMVSGGARGSDRMGMTGAIDYGGNVAGIVSGALDRLSRSSDTSSWIAEGSLCLVSHVQPNVGFSVGNAMARNKLIHGLADATLVISTSSGSGGTWAGSVENLKKGWSPLLVWSGPGAPEANAALIKEGGFAFEHIPTDEHEFEALISSATEHAAGQQAARAQPAQQALL